MEKKILGPNGHPVEHKLEERVIPEDLLKTITDTGEKRNDILNEFVQVSLQRVNLVKREAELLKKMQDNAQSLKNRIENAYKKMKLNDEKAYSWSYNGKGKFIGRLMSKKPDKK